MGTIPHIAPATWPDIRPGRFAATIARDAAPPPGARIALLGLPSDLGTRLNHGRAGSDLGPSMFRLALSRVAADWDGAESRPLDLGVWDAGDVPPAPGDDAGAMHETHRRVTEAVRALADLGLIVACIGGSHDLTFAGVRGMSLAAGAPYGGLNVDAHLDVRDPRDEPGSGMPFRALIEDGRLDPERFVEFGIDRFVNSRAHTQWLTERGGTIITAEKSLAFKSASAVALTRVSRGVTEPAFLSIDLDAIDGAAAPGVSAVNPMGLGVPDVARIANSAGADPRFRYVDIMELSPPHDEPPPPQAGRTARIAATFFMHFVAGVQDRPGAPAGAPR